MAKLAIFIGPLIFILWIYCLVNVITSRDDEVRHLPKFVWLIVVLLFPFIGSIVWLAAGRPESARRPRSRHEREVPEFPEYDRPGRMAATSPDDDAEFLRKVRERAEEQRRKAREQKRRDEQTDEDPA